MVKNSDLSDTNTDDEVLRRRQVRLRRCPSTSKVESIVTEDEKLRRAQPDKPIHKPRDSILSWGSEFTNYEGLVNWAFLLLSIGGIRLSLENFNKYGIRVNPSAWFYAIFGNLNPSSENQEYPTLFLLIYTNVPIISACFIEKLMHKNWISWTFCKTLHIINLMSVLLIPVYVINFKYEHVGPVPKLPEECLADPRCYDDNLHTIIRHQVFIWCQLLAVAVYIVLFLKLWSFWHFMEAVRFLESTTTTPKKVVAVQEPQQQQPQKQQLQQPQNISNRKSRKNAKKKAAAQKRRKRQRGNNNRTSNNVNSNSRQLNLPQNPSVGCQTSSETSAMASLSCGIYAVVFLKLWSYVQVNHWCRTAALNRPKTLAKQRHQSLAELSAHPTTAPTLPGPNLATGLTRKPRLSSMRDSFGNSVVQYPDNLSLKDIYYFWLAPTLCYELNFPRSGRIRKMFLLRRALEVVVGTNIALALAQQWIIPSVVNSLIPFSNMEFSRAIERILKLALPNHLIWLTFFYLLFHSFLNTMGEILSFADRNFYNDWWNSDDIINFWKSWNLPVHRWAVRHLYKPLLNRGCTAFQASFLVFLVSALLHEYLVSVPLRMFKYYAFLGMILQVPLMVISQHAKTLIGKRAGNLVVWLSLIIGQPLALMMYYHDFVVAHYGSELIATFGTMKSSSNISPSD